jgi:SnoaL-like domain
MRNRNRVIISSGIPAGCPRRNGTAVANQCQAETIPMKNIELDLRSLIDQRDIENVLATYARAVDRLDVELLKSCYHPEAINHNAVSRTPAWAYAEQLLPQMRNLFSGTMHHITHSQVAFESDVEAVAESYFIAWHMVVGGYTEVAAFFGAPYASQMDRLGTLGGGHDFVTAGRYLDRFEKRDATWRILERSVTVEWNHFGAVTRGTPDSLFGRMPAWARRDREDLVYSLFKPL